MKPELRSLIPKLNRYLLLLLVFICSLSVFLLLYPISSKSPQSDLDNKATLPGAEIQSLIQMTKHKVTPPKLHFPAILSHSMPDMADTILGK